MHQLSALSQHHHHRLSGLLRRIEVVAEAEMDDVEGT